MLIKNNKILLELKGMPQKVIYYKDELNDEFSGDNIKPKVIDGKWKYVHKSLWKKFTHVFWLRFVIAPIFFMHSKLKYHHKIIGKKKLKPYKKEAIFMYANHTHNFCDTFIPAFVNGYKDVYLICNPQNVSVPVLGPICPSLGALPLPGDFEATKNFKKAIDYYVSKKKVIMIYPEAHIWPYYTKIRPFKDVSFRYPLEYDTKVFCFTNAYKKRRFSKTPKIVTYVDGPFLVNKDLPKNEARKDIRDRVYNAMVERSKENNYEYIKYIKAEE